MKVYVINLKEATERRTSITKQLEELGISYELFEAINGRTLPGEVLAEKVDLEEVRKHPGWLTKGALGCALSHMGVYKRFVDSDSEWSLILEDDVVLPGDLKSILTWFEQNSHLHQDHLNLLYALSQYGPVILSSETKQKIGSYQTHKVLNKKLGGAGAYIIHKKVARRLLEINTRIRVAADTWHHFLKLGVYSQINCLYPFAAQPGYFESTIGYVNERSFIYKAKHYIEKNRLQPLYSVLKWNRRRVWKRTSEVVFG